MKKYLLFIPLLTFVACNSTPRVKPHAPRVAALLKTSTNPYFHLMWEGIKREADVHGIEVQVFWPENESNFEFQYDFIVNKAVQFDALIFAPSDADTALPYLRQLKQRGIPTIVLDADIHLPPHSKPSDYFDAYLGTNNEKGGELAADFLIPLMPQRPNVIIVEGFYKHIFSSGRTRSFRKQIMAKLPDASVRVFVGNYDRNIAKIITRKNLNTFMSADAIFCANDHMALGVSDILSPRVKTNAPLIVGYDSIKEAQEAILSGKIAASIVQFPARMGSESVKVIIDLLQKKAVATQILIDPEISIQKPTIEVVKLSELQKRR